MKSDKRKHRINRDIILTSIMSFCISFILGMFTKAFSLAGFFFILIPVTLGYCLGNLLPMRSFRNS